MQKLLLSIPEPCHENWHNMTPTEQGRYCNACAKEVIDFSMMTDTEILNYFSALTHQKVCGRALPSQLERTITRPKEPKKRLFWYWNYIVMFFMFFSKTNSAKSQGNIKPATELNPVKPVYMLGDTVITSREVTGKVTDLDGSAVSFATIRIKGTNSAVSADANGAFSIKINNNDILVVSSACFKSVEIPVGFQSSLNILMDKSSDFEEEIVATVGGLYYSDWNTYSCSAVEKDKLAILNVKDEQSDKVIEKATIFITENRNSEADTVFTDKKGYYKIKGLKSWRKYFIKITAEGYEANEFTIEGSEFNKRKKTWEVFLKKQETEQKKVPEIKNTVPDSYAGIRGEVAFKTGNDPLYVVDGTITERIDNISTDDIDDSTVLKAPEATVIWGPLGSNGVVFITTRKAKVKTLDSLVVSSEFMIRRRTHCSLCSVSCAGELNKEINNFTESGKSSLGYQEIKVYPNPVQRGNAINLSLKLKQTGIHHIQITDASGRIVLQKQVNAPAKEYTEKIQADNKWAPGIYYISIFSNQNQLVNKTSLIFQ